jgi:hypothetical protein
MGLAKYIIEQAENRFTTRIDPKFISVSGLGNGISETDPDAVIRWEAVMDFRSWGIRAVDVVIQSIDVSFGTEVETHDKVSNGDPFRIKWTPANADRWTVQVNSDKPVSGWPVQIAPVGIDVLMMERKIVVNFS